MGNILFLFCELASQFINTVYTYCIFWEKSGDKDVTHCAHYLWRILWNLAELLQRAHIGPWALSAVAIRVFRC